MGATRLSAFFFCFLGRDGVSPSAARNMRALPVDGVEARIWGRGHDSEYSLEGG